MGAIQSHLLRGWIFTFVFMTQGRVTIKDIARELKISPSTVSRALKDHPDISPETKKKVS
jgi:DNA-binding transcriptional regulator GbsR (MarR family)